MNIALKTILTASVLGLAALPAAAQTVGPARGFATARATGQSVEGYQPDGRLNVWGARVDPTQGTSVLGGVTGIVGGTAGLVGGGVEGTAGAVDAVTTGSVAPRGSYAAGRGY